MENVIFPGLLYLFPFRTFAYRDNCAAECGSGKNTVVTSIGAFFVNILANYMFIFGKLGAPAMGVAGAAIGTLIARIFEFSVIDGFLWFRGKIH